MRFRSLRKWDAPEQSSALLYFAQILEEMVFDFSMDTYKASIMHSGLLCVEALQTIDEVESGNIAEPNIAHVVEELCSTLEKDAVAQCLLPLPLSALYRTLRNPRSETKEVKNLIELLAFHLKVPSYRSKNEELLSEAVKSNEPTDVLRRLARSYVTTLTASGFSTKYIFKATIDFFYFSKHRISGNSAIDDFLQIFPKEANEYSVIFRADPVFEHAATSFDRLGVSISRLPPAEVDSERHSSFAVKNDMVIYARVETVKARDIYSARSRAEDLLKFCGTLVNLFHHKGKPGWHPECLVILKKDASKNIIKNSLNPMHKCADLVQAASKKKLQNLIDQFSLERGSFDKFVRSVQLHAMAIDSNSSENQILNLWISLESLVPSETKSGKTSGIEHIANSVTPFLNEQYISRLLNNLVKDLIRWDKRATLSSLKKIQGKKFVDKLAKLLALEEHSTERESLKAKFRDFHLLKDRFEYFQKLLSDPKNVVAALDAHRQRIDWQIRRIYRARNIIVHSGKSPTYTQPLIEHTHDYLDTVLTRLVELASKPRCILSVAQGFKFVEIRYESYHKALSEKGLKFDRESIHSLLFYH